MSTPPDDTVESSNTDWVKKIKERNDTPGKSEDDAGVFPTTAQAEDVDAFLEDTPARNAKDSAADCHSKGEFCDAEESSTSDDIDVPDAALSNGEESSSSSEDDAAPEGKESSSSSSSDDDDDDNDGGQPGGAPEGEESSSSSSDDDQPVIEVSNTSFSAVSRDDKDSISGVDDAVYPNTVLHDAEESSTSDDDIDSTSSSEDDHGASLSPEHFMLDDHLSGGAPPPMSVPIEDMEGNAADDEMGDNNVCNSLDGSAPCNDMDDLSADLNSDSDDNSDFDMEDDSDYDNVSDYDDMDDDSDYDTEGNFDDEDSDDDADVFIEGEGGALVEHRNISNGLDDANDLQD